MNGGKRCVFDGGPLNQRTANQWVCGKCALPYGPGLMQDRDAWRTFRRRAKAALEIERLTKTDVQVRATLGQVLTRILEDMAAGR